jgi:tetratricopeptide (TPR) repeat protein
LSRPTPIIFVVLFLLVFGVKFAYLQERSSWPDFEHPTLDSKYHDDWAGAIASGEWTGRTADIQRQPFFRAPLYAYFVAAVYKVSGHNYYLIRLAQILIGALSAVLVYRLTSVLFGGAAAWIAFVLCAGYWPVTHFEGELLMPVLIVFLDLCAVLLIIEAGRTQRAAFSWAAGLALGLSAITRPNIVIVIPFLLLWIWRRTADGAPRSRHRQVGFVILACAAVVAPVTIRNAVVGKDFVPIASQGGVNFFIGNNPGADGVKAVVPGTRADWWGGFDDTRAIAERAAGRELRPSQVSNYWFKEGARYLFADPVGAARLYARKLALFLGNGEVSNNRQLYFARGRSLVLRLLAVNFAVILSFGVVGIIRRNRNLSPASRAGARLERSLPLYFIVPYAISVVVFFVTSRYRLPVSVFLIPYAALGISWIVDKFRRTERGPALRYSALALAVLVASVLNPFNVGGVGEARGLYSLGVDYSHSDFAKALEAFDESIERDPMFAPAWKMRGWVKYRLRNYVEATDDLVEACRLDSAFVDAFYTLGVVYQVRELHDRAGPAYERAIALDPQNKEALTNLADVRMRSGEYDAARSLLERALRIDPAFPNAVFGLGSYYEYTGHPDEASKRYRTVLHLPAGRLGLTRLLVKEGRLDEAEAMLVQWRSMYPDAADIETLRRLVREYRARHIP